MKFYGKPAFDFGPLEATRVLAWIYPVAAFIVANCGAELLGVLQEHGLSRAGLSAAAVLLLRGAYLYVRDNEREVT